MIFTTKHYLFSNSLTVKIEHFLTQQYLLLQPALWGCGDWVAHKIARAIILLVTHSQGSASASLVGLEKTVKHNVLKENMGKDV